MVALSLGLWPARALASGRGQVLLAGADWRGVDIYDNGGDPSNTSDDSGYGYQWQCVELVQRFYRQIIWSGYDTHWPNVGDAYEMFDHPDRDLQPLVNGSARLPAWGDVLVFDRDENWPSGHVAIVTRVAAGRVYFVQQNVAQVFTDSLALDGANRIGDEGGSGIQYPPVRGWLHSPHNGGYATGNLGGYVANSRTGAGIAGTLVILSAAGSTRVTTADDTGWYWFAAVPQGDVSVRALAAGFEGGAVPANIDASGFSYAPIVTLQPDT
jgi:CHAP domain-containing protein/carboxypeptidase family protein